MKYKTILFDADMTLFNFKAEEALALEQTLLDRGYACSAEIIERYSRINDSYWKQFEQGKIDRASLLVSRFVQFLGELGIGDDAAEFNHQYLENMGCHVLLLEGVEELCRKLSKTHHLYIITNGNARNQRRRFAESGLKDFFEDIFISEEIGYQKPQIAYFDYVRANIADWDARSTLVVGDSLTSDIQGAINYGLDCCWFNPQNLPYTLSEPCTYIIQRLSELETLLYKK